MFCAKKAQVSGRTSCVRRAALLVGSLLLLGSLCAARPLVNPTTSAQLSLSKRWLFGTFGASESSHAIQEAGEGGEIAKNAKTPHSVAPKFGGSHGPPSPSKSLEKDAKELSGKTKPSSTPAQDPTHREPLGDPKVTGKEPHDGGPFEPSDHHSPDKLELKEKPLKPSPDKEILKSVPEEASTLPASGDHKARIWHQNVDNPDQFRSGFLPEKSPGDLGGN